MDGGLVAVAVISVGFLVVGLLGPAYAQRRLRRCREPGPDDLERLEAVRPPGVALPDRVLVIETVGEASVEVAIRGPPGSRVLFITDHVLEAIDAGVATALIAAEAARTRVWYREYQVVAATVAIALGSSALLLVIPFELGFGALLVAAALMLAGGRWLQYRADAVAAGTVGAAALADAFETVARFHDADLSRGGWRSYLEVQPRIGDRIARLRARS